MKLTEHASRDKTLALRSGDNRLALVSQLHPLASTVVQGVQTMPEITLSAAGRKELMMRLTTLDQRRLLALRLHDARALKRIQAEVDRINATLDADDESRGR